MSTWAYATFTAKREDAPPDTSTSTSPPGVNTYIDMITALVPAEALTLHAAILTYTTQTVDGKTEITEPQLLYWAFWVLFFLNFIFYIGSHVLTATKWDKLDGIRMFIPPLAFVGWTMLQPMSAFNAVASNLGDANRSVIAVFLAVFLGLATKLLADKADQQPNT